MKNLNVLALISFILPAFASAAEYQCTAGYFEQGGDYEEIKFEASTEYPAIEKLSVAQVTVLESVHGSLVTSFDSSSSRKHLGGSISPAPTKSIPVRTSVRIGEGIADVECKLK